MAKKTVATGSMIDRNKYGYARTKFIGPDGKARYSAGNGDAVAKALLGVTGAKFDKVVRDAGLKDLAAKHSDKNPGQFRMVIGNALRAIIRKGGSVVIGDNTITSLGQAIKQAEPPAPKKARKSKKDEVQAAA